MILVKKNSGGTGMFRTCKGSIFPRVVNGYYVVNVGGREAKDMMVKHKFHAPPAGLSLETKAAPKPAPKPAPKAEPKPKPVLRRAPKPTSAATPAPKKTVAKSVPKKSSAKATPKTE